MLLPSPCKVNLLLNILGRRPDGYHDLESVMHPVQVCDELEFNRGGSHLELTCSEPALPTNSQNLVYRAAESFLSAAGIREGVRIHLEKRLPLAAGLGGGSANAAITLLGLNGLFGKPLAAETLQKLAAALGSDVPFFLQHQPALATGRGEQIEPLGPFTALRGAAIILIHPGFGVATAWAYKNLARFPDAMAGRPGRALDLVARLRVSDLSAAAPLFYNSLEAPVLPKFPLLALFQEFLREQGAAIALMSGSGSTTFAITDSMKRAEALVERFNGKFGDSYWVRVVPVS